MKIYVIRHGLTELNKKELINGQIDEPLSKEGIGQAHASISIIPNGIKRIYSSSMMRAMQTAEILNSKIKQPISFHDELREINFGSYAGKSWVDIKFGEDLKKKHRAVQYNYQPEGESVSDVKKRIIDFLGMINGKYNDNEVLVVTHGGIIRLLSLLERGIPLGDIENTSQHSFDIDKILQNKKL
jgi:probable phosphoglycerate mutase